MTQKSHVKALSKSAVPLFKLRFLLPQYWLYWLAIVLLSLYQYLPKTVKYFIAKKLGNWQYRKNIKRRTIALENLKWCFPHWSDLQYSQFLREHFISTMYITLDMALLWWSGKKRIQKNIVIKNYEYIERAKKNNGNVILLTCHCLALDFGVVALGIKTDVVSMAKTMRNDMLDWLVSRGRTRFNVRLAARSDGLRSVVKATKQQQAFYYIPDEAHNTQRTLNTAFFAHQKKTLVALAKIKKLTNATVVPCYTHYDFKQHKYMVNCLPTMEFDDIDNVEKTTLQMNQQFETLINISPEQYMWTMRLFGPYSIDK